MPMLSLPRPARESAIRAFTQSYAYANANSAINPLRRPLSASTSRPSSSSSTSEGTLTRRQLPPPPPSRWITDLRERLGKCLIFGCDNQQVSRAAAVLRALALEWKDLLAGSEGFLTGGRRGLDGREVAWGEMDSFVWTDLYPAPAHFHPVM